MNVIENYVNYNLFQINKQLYYRYKIMEQK
jgi:hypothetical protein